MSDSNFADGFLTGANLAGLAGNVGDALDNARAVKALGGDVVSQQLELFELQKQLTRYKLRAESAEEMLELTNKRIQKLSEQCDAGSSKEVGELQLHINVAQGNIVRLMNENTDLKVSINEKDRKIEELQKSVDKLALNILGFYNSNEALKKMVKRMFVILGMTKEEAQQELDSYIVDISESSEDKDSIKTESYLTSKARLDGKAK